MKVRWVVLGLLVTLLLVPAVAISAARVLDLASGTWVRLVSFTPYAGVLYLLAWVLLVVAWVRGHGIWRGTARLLTVAALMGVIAHAYWASGPFLGTPTAEASSRTLTVMTSNLRFGAADTGQLIELAVTRDVDVLVLQEVTPEALGALRQAGIGEAFRHSAGKAAPGPSGTMVFSKSRLSDVSTLSTGFGSYALDLRVPGTPKPVRLLAVHPLPPTGDVTGWWADQRTVRQASRVLDRAAMVVGDLNATMDHAPMRELVGRGYEDAATQATSGWQPTWPAGGEVSRFGVGVPPLVAIDHVLTSNGLRATATESFAIDGTDHKALVATLALD